MQNPEDIIRKLLALAKGGTENEAALAAAKASEIALKYNIDLLDLQQKGDPPPKVGEDSVHSSTKHDVWISNILYGLSLLNNCKYYLAVYTDHFKYRVVGRKINISTVEMTAGYLIQEVKRLNRKFVEQYNYTQQERAQYRKDFRLACSRRLLDRMEELHNQRKTQTGKALLVISNMLAELDDFMKDKKIKNGKYVSSVRSRQALADGHRAANTISLDSQLGGSHAVRSLRSS